jgi:hypothetical protein
VTGADGLPLPGATVQIKGTSTGTITDLDGKYSISVEGQAEPVLVFTYVGYLTEEVVVGTQTSIDMQMSLDIMSVDEVVVVGYGTQKKSLVTGAISKISADEIASTLMFV